MKCSVFFFNSFCGENILVCELISYFFFSVSSLVYFWAQKLKMCAEDLISSFAGVSDCICQTTYLAIVISIPMEQFVHDFLNFFLHKFLHQIFPSPNEKQFNMFY